MPKQTFKTKPQLIQLLHVARSKLQMDEHVYRQNLQAWAGKASSKDMTIPQLETCLAGMKRLGFKPVAKVKDQPAKKHSPSKAQGSKDERSVIRAIWIFMHRAGFLRDGSEFALNAYVARQTAQFNGGTGIASVQWLEGKDAVMVLESLKNWCRRLMYSELQKLGADVWPAMSYQDALNKWEKLKGSSK